MAYKGLYDGLTSGQVESSRAKNGENRIPPVEKESAWRKFLGKFSDPLILILVVAGVLSLGISFYEYYAEGEGGGSLSVFLEPVGIFFAILLATGLAFIFEYKADKEFAILNQVNDDEPCTVVRDGGQVMSVPRSEIVVGDVVLLSVGEEIPADCRLLEATSLAVDESTLTGEPLCRKSVDPNDIHEEATYPHNVVLKGTKVAEGHCIAEVYAVGQHTESGKTAHDAQIDSSVKTPLDEQLGRLSSMLTKLGYSIAAAIVVIRLVSYFASGHSDMGVAFFAYFLQTLMAAVSLVVMAVPEGLPMAVTLSLAYSMRRMLSTNNLVRKLHACETMGAATVICTDKTGTLTQNQMSVADTFLSGVEGGRIAEGERGELVKLSIFANTSSELDRSGSAPRVVGNPTEGALLIWLLKNGVDYAEGRASVKVVDELPFTTVNKYMATCVRRADGRLFLLLKGAPEIVLSMSDSLLDGLTREEALRQFAESQSHAMRTIAFAYKEMAEGEEPFVEGRVVAKGLTFLGFVAIADPVRPDVPASVKECREAGIDVKIVTGDSAGVAKEIGRQIGVLGSEVEDGQLVAGTDIEGYSDDELRRHAQKIKVVCRARPNDKKRLVEALQAEGEVVAVTGDGTNDAPALKSAHVGLSMGDGTATAKDASDITIIDNSFASIGRAVLWGRSLYKNIQRFILFQMTVNVSACLFMLVGMPFSSDLPLNVMQMLWVNLIMDTFAAMALASLPPSESVMQDKPRDRSAFIISKAMARNIFGVGTILTVLFLALYYAMLHYDMTDFDSLLHGTLGAKSGEGVLTPYEKAFFFTTFVMAHFWNMFNARAFDTGRSAFRLKGCSGFAMIAVLIVVGQVLITEFFPDLFGIGDLDAGDWLTAVVVTMPIVLVGEVVRAFSKK